MNDVSRRSVPLLAIAALLMGGCGSGAGGSTGGSRQISLASATLSQFTASYRVSGPSTGTVTVAVTAPSGGTVTVRRDASIADLTEHDTFVVAAKGLAVHTASEQISAPGEKVSISAHPRGNRMIEKAIVNGRAEAPSVPLTSPWQVNNVLLTAFSGLRLESGATATIEDVLLQRATSTPVGLKVGKETTVSTPAGSMRCFPIAISAGGKVQTAWYEADAPHAMVKYVNGPETFVLTALSQ